MSLEVKKNSVDLETRFQLLRKEFDSINAENEILIFQELLEVNRLYLDNLKIKKTQDESAIKHRNERHKKIKIQEYEVACVEYEIRILTEKRYRYKTLDLLKCHLTEQDEHPRMLEQLQKEEERRQQLMLEVQRLRSEKEVLKAQIGDKKMKLKALDIKFSKIESLIAEIDQDLDAYTKSL